MNDSLNDIFDIMPSLPKKVENNIERTQIMDNKIKILESKVDKSERMTNDNHTKIRNIESKIQDLNILELFKNSTGENGEEHNIMSIINNLDKIVK